MTYNNFTPPSGAGDSAGTGDEQPFDLFNQPPVVRSIIAGRTNTLTERFEAWLGDNPEFYSTLVKMARQFLRETGSNKLGVQQLLEAARWNYAIRTRSTDFKINNDYGSFLARLLMHDHADLRGVFDLRRADEADAWIASLETRAA